MYPVYISYNCRIILYKDSLIIIIIMLPRNARHFMPKDIILVGGICCVFLIRKVPSLPQASLNVLCALECRSVKIVPAEET